MSSYHWQKENGKLVQVLNKPSVPHTIIQPKVSDEVHPSVVAKNNTPKPSTNTTDYTSNTSNTSNTSTTTQTPIVTYSNSNFDLTVIIIIAIIAIIAIVVSR